jgi:hypothetical protein
VSRKGEKGWGEWYVAFLRLAMMDFSLGHATISSWRTGYRQRSVLCLTDDGSATAYLPNHPRPQITSRPTNLLRSMLPQPKPQRQHIHPHNPPLHNTPSRQKQHDVPKRQ